MLEGKVAPEPASGASHRGKVQVVEASVNRAPFAQRGIQIGRDLLLDERGFLCVVKILTPELVADLDQPWHREHFGELVPRASALQEIAYPSK